MLVQQSKAVPMHQSITSRLSVFSGVPTIVVEHKEIDYLRNAFGMLKVRQRSFVTTAMKNYCTIPSFFRLILRILPLWSRSDGLTKTERQNQKTKLQAG